MSKENNWSGIERSANEKLHRAELDERDKLIKQYEQRLAETSDQLNVALAVNTKKPQVTPIVRAASETGESTAFALCSDWHYEERVRPESVNGMNEFDLTIARARVKKLFQSILRLVEIERNGTVIDNLVLALMGDLITGYIHEELQETNQLSPVQAIVEVRDVVLAGIDLLRKEGKFKRIIVPCCYGNHGRTTRKPRHATGAANSYEWLLYQVLQRDAELMGWKNVEFNIAQSYHTYLELYGKRIRLHHGDGLRYEGGIGGLTIPLEKSIAAWNKGIVADLDVFGHWHTQQQNPKWCSNGSLIGFNAFSIAIKAAFEHPQQTFFLFDSKRGRTGTWPIFLS